MLHARYINMAWSRVIWTNVNIYVACYTSVKISVACEAGVILTLYAIHTCVNLELHARQVSKLLLLYRQV